MPKPLSPTLLLLLQAFLILPAFSSNSQLERRQDTTSKYRIRYIRPLPDSSKRTDFVDATKPRDFSIGNPPSGSKLIFKLYRSTPGIQAYDPAGDEFEFIAVLGTYLNQKRNCSSVAWKLNDYNLTRSGGARYLIEGEALDVDFKPYRERVTTKSALFQVLNIREKSNATFVRGFEAEPDGLTRGEKIGLGVGTALGGVLILMAFVFLIRQGARGRGSGRRKDSSSLKNLYGDGSNRDVVELDAVGSGPLGVLQGDPMKRMEILKARRERIEKEREHIQRLMEIEREEEEVRAGLAGRKYSY